MQEAPFWRNSPTHYKKLWYCILFVTSSRHSFFFLFVAVSTILICYLSLVFINSSCCSLVLVESLYQLLVINYQLSTICYSYLSSIIIDIYDLLICRHVFDPTYHVVSGCCLTVLHTCQAQSAVDFCWFHLVPTFPSYLPNVFWTLLGFGALNQPTLDSLVLLSISGSKCACFASLCLWPQGRYQS